MKIKNSKIIECTQLELYDYWLKQWSDIFSFTEYMERVQELGTKVTDESKVR